MASSSSLLSLFALLLLSRTASAQFACGTNDNATVCTALSSFYSSLGGASWTNSSGWGTDTSYCTPWVGLTCSNGSIIAISFNTGTGNNLVGTLPDVFNAFSSTLQSFQVRSSSVTGALPPSFFNLHSQITIV